MTPLWPFGCAHQAITVSRKPPTPPTRIEKTVSAGEGTYYQKAGRMLSVPGIVFFIACLILSSLQPVLAAETTAPNDDLSTVVLENGGIVRGPRDKKVIALEFTGGSFADGGTTILAELKKRDIKASFFFTGDFFRITEFGPLIHKIRGEGHYLGPHSDKHPLYASWDNPPKLQVTREEFDADLDANFRTLAKFNILASDARFFIPPFEHYTPEISDWTSSRGMVLINLTRGTRSPADYMQDDDPKFVSAADIVRSILDYEKKDAHGLNGFLLLMHVGSGPGRTKDKLYNHLGSLLDELLSRGYRFARVDEMLSGK